jgi:hypothetical protein
MTTPHNAALQFHRAAAASLGLVDDAGKPRHGSRAAVADRLGVRRPNYTSALGGRVSLDQVCVWVDRWRELGHADLGVLWWRDGVWVGPVEGLTLPPMAG